MAAQKGPTSGHRRRGRPAAHVLCALLCAPAWAGCDAADHVPSRSEPWRKDELALARQAQSHVRYRAETGQSLSFVVQAKAGAVRGLVPIAHAELELDPQALDATRGRLTFDLQRLTLERFAEEEGEGAALGGDLLLTEAARLWLSLGPEVPAERRAQAERAHFDLRLGRALSSHSIQGGAPIPGPGTARRSSSARRVTGIVEGDLLLMGREVTHVLEAEVDFSFSPSAREQVAPERVVVRLKRALAVPLAEHAIAPRDARGDAVSQEQARLGRGGLLRAQVTGSLAFERASD